MDIDQQCWIPLDMLPKTLTHNMFVERDHRNNCFLSVWIQLTVFNKDGHMAKSKTLKNDFT
jgi:hypothetical protein